MALTGVGDELRSVLYRDECWGDFASTTWALAAENECSGACLSGGDTGVLHPPEEALERPLDGGAGDEETDARLLCEATDEFWATRAL